jgi:hypothetical protein
MSENLKVPGIARNACLLACVLAVSFPLLAQSPGSDSGLSSKYPTSAIPNPDNVSRSVEYGAVQKRLARGWNTWDVNSVTTHVLLPEGLAIHVAMKHNSTLYGDALLMPGTAAIPICVSPGRAIVGVCKALTMAGIL